MKNIAVFVLLALVVAFVACKKSKNQSVDLQMSANVNGLPWRSYSSYVALDNAMGNTVVITGDSTNSNIKLRIDNYHGVDTYYVSTLVNTASYNNYSAPSGAQEHKASSGQIIVTSSFKSSNTQTTIKGTFSFLSGGISVTNGLFDVKLNLN